MKKIKKFFEDSAHPLKKDWVTRLIVLVTIGFVTYLAIQISKI